MQQDSTSRALLALRNRLAPLEAARPDFPTSRLPPTLQEALRDAALMWVEAVSDVVKAEGSTERSLDVAIEVLTKAPEGAVFDRLEEYLLDTRKQVRNYEANALPTRRRAEAFALLQARGFIRPSAS